MAVVDSGHGAFSPASESAYNPLYRAAFPAARAVGEASR